MYMFLDTTYGNLFHMILLIPARSIARRLPGAVVPNDEKALLIQEEECNDPTIIWPSPEAIAKLPKDWVVDSKPKEEITTIAEAIEIDITPPNVHATKKAKKRRSPKHRQNTKISTSDVIQADSVQHIDNTAIIIEQPYYLNHVRGSTFIRKASQRIAAAMGTLFASFLMIHIFDDWRDEDGDKELRPLHQLYAGSSENILRELCCGFAIGSFLVIMIFLIELKMGWILIIGYMETVVPEEKFTINIIWDILFHIGVSINEEIMLRGWMFVLAYGGLVVGLKDWGIYEDYDSALNASLLGAMILQSTLFALLHYGSPGSSRESLLNLFLGGIAATINVLVAQGHIYLSIGWHFWLECKSTLPIENVARSSHAYLTYISVTYPLKQIWMGHLLGRSTSGIPMSCALINVIPYPNKAYEKYHGGINGPEMGKLVPLAYVISMIIAFIYAGIYSPMNENSQG